MQVLQSYLNRGVADVLIDDSPQLRMLAEHARSMRKIPFDEKLPGVKQLVLGAMDNACEIIDTDTDAERIAICREIVREFKPISYALAQRAGCCRYQGALLFVLGYEADLGDRHFIQYAGVDPQTLSVFNDIFDGEQLHRTSIFYESLRNKALDYSAQNPRLFDNVVQEMEYETFFSYHRQHDGGLVMVRNNSRHILQLPDLPATV